MPAFPKICILGLGYIGLPTAAVFARSGFQVHGVDVNPATVETIRTGKAHIVEVDLDGLIQAVISSGRLTVSTEVEAADIFIIAVPTPLTEQNTADLQAVMNAVEQIAPCVERGNLIIIESTVPPGTTDAMCALINDKRPDLEASGGVGASYHAAHCPERVLPGRILIELIQNDRIIGGVTEICGEKAQALYDQVIQGACYQTNARTAELAKLTENAFRDVNIAFANELSLICDAVDVDVWDLIALANKHPRVNVLRPGPGVGGHCIAVDPWFIAERAPEHANLISLARTINDKKPQAVIDKVEALARRFKSPTIACLGLAFKANVDDLRASPAVTIASTLASKALGKVIAVEPHIDTLPEDIKSAGIELVSLEHALTEADIIVTLADHRAFKKIPAAKVAEKSVVDTRGIWR
ncbi:MAG: UDP-N-acetyl-D-mannosamine dehydrogenase [Pseudomonadota bacterium]